MANEIIQVNVDGQNYRSYLPLPEAKKFCIYFIGDFCKTTSPATCDLKNNGSCRNTRPTIRQTDIPQE